MDRPVVQAPDLMGRVMVEAVPVQDFKVIKQDTSIKGTKATREATTIKGTSSSSSQVIRAILSS